MKNVLVVLGLVCLLAGTAGAERMVVNTSSIPSGFDVVYDSVDGDLQVDSQAAEDENTIVYALGTNSYSTNYKMSCYINTDQAGSEYSEVGLINRGSIGTFSAYFASVNFGSDNPGGPTFNLAKYQFATADNLHWAPASLSPSGIYKLEFSCIGSYLNAKLYSGTTLLATRYAWDSTFSSGQFGALLFNPVDQQKMHGTWDDMTIKAMYLGDANLDGTVNLQDLSILASHYGQTYDITTVNPDESVGVNSWASGDFNHDGTVNLQDLSILASNYGLGSAGMEVPEPMTLSLLALSGLGLLRRRS